MAHPNRIACKILEGYAAQCGLDLTITRCARAAAGLGGDATFYICQEDSEDLPSWEPLSPFLASCKILIKDRAREAKKAARLGCR